MSEIQDEKKEEENVSEIDKRLENVDIEYMLEFETQIFLDIIHNDGLVIAAKGLNMDLVLSNMFKVYSDPGNLVLVLNASDAEENYFISKLKDCQIYRTTFTTSIPEREDVYLSGGIHFITTRILVVDLLKNRVPIDKITGFIILRAHKLIESCQEAFALRLFRQHNKTGFIKAFTNSPQSFTMGFGQVERVMRTLFVKELYIWPRFHSTVIQSLKKYEPKVVELHVPISTSMSNLQTYLLELMNLTVAELKRLNKTVELQEITVENCLTKNFHKILQILLDAIWHQLSQHSRQLVADLKTLRYLITQLHYTDSVTFYSTLSSFRTMEHAHNTTWVLREQAESLFSQSSKLVFNNNKELCPELSPKWTALLEILKVEIPQVIKKTKNQENKVVILCYDNRSCFQLKELLARGPHNWIFFNALEKGISFKKIDEKFKNFGKIREKPEPSKKQKLDEAEKCEEYRSNYLLTMSQQDDDNDITFLPFEDELDDLNISQVCRSLTAPTVLIQTFKGTKGSMNLQRSLEEINPSFIIMYHSNITAIREIEMYESHRKRETPLQVYFLIHGSTVEEQSYLTAMRREKEAFEFLIERKSTMVVPEDQDGKTDICTALQRDFRSPTKNTRQGGQNEVPARRFVIVDMREFRSGLPALIHKRGVDIEPVTITVGDYILTPEICIERKSLSDLVGSLTSGRLYQQCTQMFRYYTKPMLLIEFDQNKRFSWDSQYMVSSDSKSFDIQSRLLLLTLHFTKLRLIWSPSPYASAQLFDELKEGKEEPDITFASAVGGSEDLDQIGTKYNSNIYDFVQKLPGINSKNIDGFLRRAKTLHTALTLSKEELKDILGNIKDANSLYSALHEDHNPKQVDNKRKEKRRFAKKK